jgi:Flp pilus assembly pilin Flp
MLALLVRFQVRLLGLRSDDRGQTTAEYALVLLGAAAIALLLVAWATKTNRIGKLLDFVVDQIIGRVT